MPLPADAPVDTLSIEKIMKKATIKRFKLATSILYRYTKIITQNFHFMNNFVIMIKNQYFKFQVIGAKPYDRIILFLHKIGNFYQGGW